MPPTVLHRPISSPPPVAEWEAAAERHGIPVAGRDDVAAYLAARPELASRLDAAFGIAREEFPPPASLVLRLYRDPEFPDVYLQLYAWSGAGTLSELVGRIDRAAALLHEFFGDAADAVLLIPGNVSHEAST